jgi:hypothetical protein
MQRICCFAVVLLLAAGVARPAAAVRSPSEARQVNARQLMRMVESAYEDLMRAAQLSGGGRLDARVARNRPFWSSLDRMGRSVEEVGTALRARDARFFQALERGSLALGELRVLRARSGASAPEVDRALSLLASSYRLLRRGYGAEQARYERGGALSDSERQRFERIQAAQRELAGHLEVLRRKAGERRDRATVAELNRLIAEAYRIASAPATLDSYLNALIAADEMRGEWNGNRFYAEPADKAEWQAASQVVEELHVEAEVGHLFVVDLGSAGDLSQLDELTDLPVPPEAAAPAVQVFVPDEEEVVVEEAAGEGVAPAGILLEEIPAVEEATEAPAGELEEVEAVEEAAPVEEGVSILEDEVIEEEDLPVEEGEPSPAASGEPPPETGPPPPR